MFNSPRVIFEKGDLLGETAPEIIKNTKLEETKVETKSKTKTIKKSDNDQLNIFFDDLGKKC